MAMLASDRRNGGGHARNSSAGGFRSTSSNPFNTPGTDGDGEGALPPSGPRDFSANEQFIEQLVHCKTGVMGIHRQILAAQKIIDNIGTRKDSEEMRDKLDEVIAAIKERVTQMENMHAEMAVYEKQLKRSAGQNKGHERIEKGHIAQRKKIQGDLKKEKANLKLLEKKARVKTRQFPPPSPASRPSTSSWDQPGHPNASFKLTAGEGEKGSAGTDGVFVSRDAMERTMMSQMIVEGELEVNEALIRERQEAMVEINRQLNEVNEIFKDLSRLVDDQTEDIHQIHDNVAVTHAAAERGLVELKRAEEIQKKSTCSVM